MNSHAFSLALFSVGAIVASLPAQGAGPALLTRTFVSSAGNDGNPCTIAAPCATFARAYTLTQPTGIIAALDPGKYGALAITSPITINGNGWAAITAPGGGNGITVNAVSGNVTLTGLEVDGAGAGANGIVFSTGNSLTISNCIIKDFVTGSTVDGSTGNGIWIAPLSNTVNFTIVNTTVSNNSFTGITFRPPELANTTASGSIDHVIATNNGEAGILLGLLSGSGTGSVAISNSIVSNNATNGILVDALGLDFALNVVVDNDQINNNQFGVLINSGIIGISRSTFLSNTMYGAWLAVTGTAGTYQDNRYLQNGNGNTMPGFVPAALH